MWLCGGVLRTGTFFCKCLSGSPALQHTIYSVLFPMAPSSIMIDFLDIKAAQQERDLEMHFPRFEQVSKRLRYLKTRWSTRIEPYALGSITQYGKKIIHFLRFFVKDNQSRQTDLSNSLKTLTFPSFVQDQVNGQGGSRSCTISAPRRRGVTSTRKLPDLGIKFG